MKTKGSGFDDMKVVSLISGGIDSPAATHLFMEKDIEILGVYFDNKPFLNERKKEKALNSIEKISNLHDVSLKTYVVPHGDIITKFLENSREKDRKYSCLFCRRMMFRVAELIVKNEGADAIVTGESLGQVASQTLNNIGVASSAINIPVLRPLIGFDKNEIIEKVAKDIGTFNITSGGSCCIAVPKKPEVAGKEDNVVEAEKSLGINLEALSEKALKHSEILKI